MPEKLATQDEGVSALLAFVFSGAIGPPEGKGVSYALAESTATSFSWVAALEDMDGPPVPIDRYLITFNRLSKEILAPRSIVLSNGELADAVLAATGQHLASSARFTDGALSISYKITVQERSDIATGNIWDGQANHAIHPRGHRLISLPALVT